MDGLPIERIALGMLVLLSIAAVVAVLRPLAVALFIAAVLAGAIQPLYERLARRLRGRRNVAAGLIVAIVVITVAGPIAFLGTVLIREAMNGVTFVQRAVENGGTQGLLDTLPAPIASVWNRALAAVPFSKADIGQWVGVQASRTASFLGAAFAATSHGLIQAVLAMVAFYFLLLDGSCLVAWIDRVSPLRPSAVRSLLMEFRQVAVAVIVSTGVTAGVQAAAAGIGYLIAGVPHPFFFALVTLLLALIPAVGAAVAGLALSGLLAVTGHPWKALFLAIWSLVVVGLVDNFVKPILIRSFGGVAFPSSVVFFSLVGGIAAFGAVGLLLGPLSVAFFMAAVRMAHEGPGPES